MVDEPTGENPDLSVDPTLPIAAHQAEIAALILKHQVVVVAGETGSGKTTQLPKICLALGRSRIGHTQPRRIAARSVAARLAAETGTTLGSYIGYQVRFTAETARATRLKVMTDGILLAEIAHDRLLRRYDTIIIDEAHERSLNIDFLLGYIKQLCPRRPDLKVIITSATIDTARFSQHFDGAPIVEVSGRGYPIEYRYRPVGDMDQADAIVAALRALPTDDTLVFLAGEREIRDAAAAIEAARLRDTHVLPLYARLTMDEQARVFSPHEGRRVVLATNVAETSLTVPGIRCVIDPGFARIARYSARAKVQRLPIEPISRASADQRAGRCGRVAPGICVRLYSEDDYESRPAFTEPEILRTNLASVILAMTVAKLGDIADFPFVDAPDRRHVDDGVRLLTELGAITVEAGHLRLTRIGRRLAELPIDPALARIVLEGDARGCLREGVIIAAALSVPDVRERPFEHRADADAAHARFGADDAGGDIAAVLRLWRYLGDAQRDLSGSQFRKLCGREYLNYLRVREWQDLVSQLRTVTRGMKMHARAEAAPIEAVLKACLAGLLSHIGTLDAKPADSDKKRRGPREYLGARGTRFAIAPDSVLARRDPPLVMAVELVETSRLWAHGVAAIEPEWAEDVGAAWLRRSYSEPAFSAAMRRVQATERTTLFGVPLGVHRVDYASVDQPVARAIFIRTGLVEQQLSHRPGSPAAPVLDHFEALRSAVDALEVKTRRRGLLVTDDDMVAWFDARLPADVTSGPALEAWLRGHSDRVTALMPSLDDLLAAVPPDEADYPDRWVVGSGSFGLDYHFAPGETGDGVTVNVPLADLSSLPAAPFTWGVPGQRLELATALIRSLPKQVRRHVVPAPEYAARALEWLKEHNGDFSQSFADELGRALTALTGEDVTGWQIDDLPPHLRPVFRVDDGVTTHVDRDLPSLQSRLGQQVTRTLAQGAAKASRTGNTWVFATLPGKVRLRRGGIEMPAFPALQDAGNAVRETFVAELPKARRIHRQGLIRLVALNLPDPSRGIFAHLGSGDLARLAAGPYESVTALLADARDAAIGQLLDARGDPWDTRDETGFEAALEAVRPNQATVMTQVVKAAVKALEELGRVEALMARFPAGSSLVSDVTAQLDDLVFDGFLHAIPGLWLNRLPVWLDGIARRLEKALADPVRDERGMAELAPVLNAFDELVAGRPTGDEEVDRLGFLIEELRLQTFAQPVRTVETVSVKRLLTMIKNSAAPSRA